MRVWEVCACVRVTLCGVMPRGCVHVPSCLLHSFLTQGPNPADPGTLTRCVTNRRSIRDQDTAENLAAEADAGYSIGQSQTENGKRAQIGSQLKLGNRAHPFDEFKWREQLIEKYHKTGQERDTEISAGARRGWNALNLMHLDTGERISADVHGDILGFWKWTKTSVMQIACERTYITHTHAFIAHTHTPLHANGTCSLAYSHKMILGRVNAPCIETGRQHRATSTCRSGLYPNIRWLHELKLPTSGDPQR